MLFSKHVIKKREEIRERRKRAANTNDFREYLAETRLEINNRIEQHLEMLDPSDDLSDEIVDLAKRGKRLRAGISMLVFEAFASNGNGRDMALDLAVAIEFAHSASLVIDDMLDEDGARRGVSSLHLSKGQKRAMLEAVGMLSFPYSIASSHGSSYVNDLCDIHRSMVYGAISEVVKRPNLPASIVYEEIITRKTGDLFGLATRFGALSAGCEPSLVDSMWQYGRWTGMAMQMANDIADLDQIMDGAKSTGFGTELLLLQCIVTDNLFKKLVSEIEAQRIEAIRSGIAATWRLEGLEEELDKRLGEAIKRAEGTIEDLKPMRSQNSQNQHFREWMPVLLMAPQQIAEMVLEE